MLGGDWLVLVQVTNSAQPTVDCFQHQFPLQVSAVLLDLLRIRATQWPVWDPGDDLCLRAVSKSIVCSLGSDPCLYDWAMISRAHKTLWAHPPELFSPFTQVYLQSYSSSRHSIFLLLMSRWSPYQTVLLIQRNDDRMSVSCKFWNMVTFYFFLYLSR